MTLDSPDSENLWVIYGLRLVDDFEYRYIGLTTIGHKARFSRHKTNLSVGLKSKVYSWMKSVGPENITCDVLEVCPVGDKEYIFEAEMYWISQIQNFGHRLTNMTEGGGGSLGASWKLPDETKRRQGLAKVGHLNPQYGKPAWNSGKEMDEKWLETRSNAQKKLWKDPEYRRRMSEAHSKPRPHQSEVAKKICHKRWHINRNIVKDDCELCVPE